MYTLLNAPIDRVMDFDVQTLYGMAITFFNTAILVFALYKILYKPVTNILDTRTKNIQNSLNEASQIKKEAEVLKEKYELVISNADAEKSTIIEEATKRARELEENILKTAREEAKKIKEAATREIELQKSKASRDMREQILDISSLIAGRYVEASIDLNLQEKLLNEAIQGLGDATWLS